MNYFKNFDLDILTNLSQLIIKGNKERIKFLKSNKYDINNLIFNNVRHLYIENANIIFKNTFPKLERLILKNAFGVISEERDFNYNNLSLSFPSNTIIIFFFKSLIHFSSENCSERILIYLHVFFILITKIFFFFFFFRIIF